MALLRAPEAPVPLIGPTPLGRAEVELRKTVSGMATERRRQRRVKVFSILSLAPDLMPGERLTADEVALIERTLDTKLRRDDCYCQVADGSFLIVLEGCTDEDAVVVAHRLKLELMSKSAGIKRRNWHAGLASYPRDGKTQASLIRIARAATIRRRPSKSASTEAQ